MYYYLRKHKNDIIIGLDKLTYAGNLANLYELTEDEQARFLFTKGDICDKDLVTELFQKHEITAVVNFAAESHVDRSIYDPQVFLVTNILGTHTLLQVAKEAWEDDSDWTRNRRFLQISTDEVYGSLGPTGHFTEKSPITPRSPYASSKASADLIAQAYFETFGMPLNITRCSNNYGPYQFPEKLVPLMIINALKHKPLPIYGDGMQVRDWLHVDDHCRAIDLVLQKAPVGEVYNVGGHNEMTNISIVEKIIHLVHKITGDSQVNRDLVSFVQDRLGHDKRYAIDSSKIQNDLGWKPEVGFDEGLESTVEWYIGRKDWLRQVISGEYMKFYEMHYCGGGARIDD